MIMRTIFLIDGFNLYHSIVDIAYYHGLKVKWLNIRSLCESYLHLIDRSATLEGVYYFSALAFHLNDPSVIERHQTLNRCLRETGIEVELSRFKPHNTKCPRCNARLTRHEEKETDVAIASKMFEVLANDECDSIVIMTGDTDLAPAVRTAKHVFPAKHILFAFPYRRKNEELAQIAPGSFKMHRGNYVQHQFPDPFPLSDGTVIPRPSSW